MMNGRMVLVLGLMAMSLFAGSQVFGADFPTKPVTIICPTQAGGGNDTDARSIAPYLEKYLGVRVSVENIPGADAKIGMTKFSKSKPDGYTLLVHTHPSEIIQPRIFDVEFNPGNFSPVYLWTSEKGVVVCAPGKWNTLEELVKEGRERSLAASSAARGAPSHFNTLRFVDKMGVKVRWVPFSGGAESLSALAGGHVDFSAQAEGTATPLIRAKKIKPLAIMSRTRSRFHPDVPSAKELGYDIDWVTVSRACWAPPNTPPEVVKKLDLAFDQATKDPGYLAWAKNRMVEVYPLNTAGFIKLIEEQMKIVVRDLPRYREAMAQ